MTSRTRVPRASLAVSLLRDPDYIILSGMGMEGHAAFSAFVSLIMAAKDLGNGGRFTEPLDVVASMIRWEVSDLNSAIKRIQWCCKENGHRPWLTVTKGGSRIRLRNFNEWNTLSGEWGGKRAGAGRKRLESPSESSCNQDETPPQVGVGKGNGVLPEGSLRGTEPSASEIFLARDFSAELWRQLPDHAKTGPNDITAAIAMAMRDFDVDGQFIVDRTLAYYRSPKGRAEFYRNTKPANFIASGGYLEPDENWKDPNAKPGDTTAPASTKRGEAARAQRLAQDEAVRQEQADDPDALARAAKEFTAKEQADG